MMEDSINVTRTFSPQSTDTNEHHRADRLVIKAQLGNDIRKLIIHNEDLSLNELSLMMMRIFKGSLSNDDDLIIKYLDDEGDKVTLCDDSDLKLALQSRHELRLFVITHKNSVVSNRSKKNHLTDASWINAETFKIELQQIRNSVQTILDRLPLEKNPNVEISHTNVKSPVINTNTSTIAPLFTKQIDSLASTTKPTTTQTDSPTSDLSYLNNRTNPSMSKTPSIEFNKEVASSTTNPFSLPRSLLSSGRYPTSSIVNTTQPGVTSSSKIFTPPNYSTTTGFSTPQTNPSWNPSATRPNSSAQFPYRSQ